MNGTILVFDNAGSKVFLWAYENGHIQALCEHQPQRSFLTVFPERLAAFFRTVSIEPSTKVYLGIGPGSFTGIKSGVSLVSAFLYARGVFEVHCVSSLDLLTARAAPDIEDTCLAVMPFHEKEVFATVVRRTPERLVTVVPPSVIPTSELGTFVFRCGVMPSVIASDDPTSEINETLETLFPAVPRRIPREGLSPALLSCISPLAIVDVRRDPLRLCYLAAPAALREDERSLYVSADEFPY